MKKAIIACALVIGALIALFHLEYKTTVDENKTYREQIVGLKAKITTLTETNAAKVERLKDAVVNDLAQKCETKDHKEPDSVIIFDSNNEPSIGAWQFQRKTVQAYVKMFEGRDITRVEAIQIAIDHERAFQLAKRIIFEDKGKSHLNWYNCSKKLGLAERVAILKELD